MNFEARRIIAAAILALASFPKQFFADARNYTTHHRGLFVRDIAGTSNIHNAVYDVDMAAYMHKAFVTKMETQAMIHETLILGGEVVSFADENLAMVRVTSNGTDAHIYRVLDHGRHYGTTADGIILVLKDNGIVKDVTKHVLSTGEKINAILMVDGSYAVYSTDDIDQQALSKLHIDLRAIPNNDDDGNQRNIHKYSLHGSDINNRDRRHLPFGTCDSYTVIRIDIRFDSSFCAASGGRQGAIEKIHSIIADANIPFNASPLCMKIETCQVDGYCYSAASDDPYQQIINASSDFCQAENNLLDNFQKYIYPPGNDRSDQCDSVHLFFGDGSDSCFLETGTVGCAFGSICSRDSVGVNRVGLMMSNPAAQAALFAHVLGHNMHSSYDAIQGYLMFPSICPSCSFSPQSITNMTSYAKSFDVGTCFSFEVADALLPVSRVPSPPRQPSPAPTRLPSTAPTRQPSPAPTRPPPTDDKCFTIYTDRTSCNRASGDLCTWRAEREECWQRSNMTCEDYSNEVRCVLHGDQCVWGTKSSLEPDYIGCFNPCIQKTDRKSCNRVSLNYCTWRPELGENGECWFRYKMTCPDYSNEHQCIAHDQSCDWIDNRCVELTKLPAGP